jgi:uncharacterized protein (DUF1786 family)
MGRYLLVDIGAGTMDVLYYDDQADLHYKAVVVSPVRQVAQKAAATRGDLLVTGVEMGGGPVTEVLRQRAAAAKVVMSASAAATLHHDPERLRNWGIRVVADAEAGRVYPKPNYTQLVLADLQADRLERIVSTFGVPFDFDALAVCAQDHGVPPRGVSHLDYRHHLFVEALQAQPSPHGLLFRADEVPATMNRLKAIAETAGALTAGEVYVMDSGMAAILGAAMDPAVGRCNRFLVLDVATSHTVGAAMEGGELAGFFEYHTRDITCQRLDSLLPALADGQLEHRRILEEGGHGAFLRRAVGFERVEAVVATGPKRRLIRKSRLPITYGAPLGDNMMTGTVGLLEALRRRKRLAPMVYV